MREILFRAKTKPNCKDVMTGKIIKNPKWIYGYIDLGYMHDCKDPLISDEKGNKTYRCQYETVGQYTGLTDKNGKKIFEGDIIKADNGTQSCISVVKFGKYLPQMFYKMLDMFCPNKRHIDAVGFYAETTDKHEQMILFQSPCVEVIGNIHDNPELLGVTE